MLSNIFIIIFFFSIFVFFRFLRPLGSEDYLYKLENFGWSVGVATDRGALPLTCPNKKTQKNPEKKHNKKSKKKENEKKRRKKRRKIKNNKNIFVCIKNQKEKKGASKGYLPRRLKTLFFFFFQKKMLKRNRAAIEARKNEKIFKKNKTKT